MMGRNGKDKIGVVLEGGGGRGAYHIGVWKALRESGLDKYVSAISGTSVGGLNAALFVQGDYDKAEEVWRGISVKSILSKKTLISTIDELEEKGFAVCARDGLFEIIKNALDLSIFDDDSSIPCYVTCVRTKKIRDGENVFKKHFDTQEVECGCPKSYSIGKIDYFNMRDYNPDERIKILLATSAIPFIFPQEKIRDYYYVDGGVKDNQPIDPLIEKEGCNIIIVVHLSREPEKKDIDEDNYPETRIYHIRPLDSQGGFIKGTLNFSPEDAMKRIQQGYDDNIEMFNRISMDIKKSNQHDKSSEEYYNKRRQYEYEVQKNIKNYNDIDTGDSCTNEFTIGDYIINQDLVDEYISEHSMAECYQLLSALEFNYQNTDALNRALDELGFFRFFTKKRTKKKLRKNDKAFKRVSIELFRLLICSIEKNYEFTREEFLKTYDTNLEIIKELRGVGAKADLTRWLITLPYRRVGKEGDLYKDLSVCEKVYRVIADCAVNFVECKITEADIYSALERLDILDSRIDFKEFSSLVTICSNDIFLYPFWQCNSEELMNDDMSKYGSLVYSYPNIQYDVINSTDDGSVNDIEVWDEYCHKITEKLDDWNEVDSFELCNSLIKDIRETVLPVINQRRECIVQDDIKGKVSTYNDDALSVIEPKDGDRIVKDDQMTRDTGDFNDNSYIIKITPEGVWKISSNYEPLLLFKGDPGKKYILSTALIEYIEDNVEKMNPKVWVVSRGVLEGMPVVKTQVKTKAPVVYLSDYYLVLRNKYCSADDEDFQFLVFAEYYNHCIYFQGYRLDDSEEGYSKAFLDLSVDYNSLKKNIIKPIEAMCGCAWDQIKKYRTFEVEAYLSDKLDSKRVRIHNVDKKWETIFNESEEKFNEITNKMISISEIN